MTDGHGGKMVSTLREKLRGKNVGDNVTVALQANTLGVRLEAMKGEAAALARNFHSALNDQNQAAIHGCEAACKDMLAEYIKLDGLSRDPNTHTIDEDKLNELDVPWGKIEAMKRKAPTQNADFRRLVGDKSPQQLLDLMEHMSRDSQPVFMGNLAAEYAAKAQAPAAQAPDHPDNPQAQANEVQQENGNILRNN